MSTPERRSHVLIIYGLAALVPIAIAGGMWLMSHLASRLPQGEIVQLTQGRVFEGLPSLSPDGSSIAYRSDAAGNGDILVRRISDRDAVNLTAGSLADESDPAFSPDGNQIAFSVAGAGIHLIAAAGGAVRQLTSEGKSPAWYPDGTFIVYAVERSAPEGGTGVSEAWKVHVDTGQAIELLGRDFREPAVSPRQRRIAYWGRPVDSRGRRVVGGRGQIWTMRVDGTDRHRLTGEAANEWSPIWSRDGRYLYYISDRGGSPAIWRARIDESSGRLRGLAVVVPTPYSRPARSTLSADGRRFGWSDATPVRRAMRVAFDEDARITRGRPVEATAGEQRWESAEPSPDGTALVLSSAKGQLHVANADGSGAWPLTPEASLDRHARWSPNGQWIAFQSTRGGSDSTWLIRRDGQGLRELARAAGDLLHPVWSPDGDQLMVWDTALSSSRVVRMADEAPPGDGLGRALPAGFLPADWSPDGQSIAGSVAGAVWLYSLKTNASTQFRPGSSPVWLNDSRRLLYASNGRLYIADAVLKVSRELLAIPDHVVDLPRLSRDNRQLYFTEHGTDANLWMMTVSR